MNTLSHEDLMKHIPDPNVLENILGLSRSQAWRLSTGKSKLPEASRELVMLKIGIHPTHRLVKKRA